MQKKRVYEYEGKTIPATITYKRMRSLRLRYVPDEGSLRISVPYGTLMMSIDHFVTKYLPKVLKKVDRKKQNYDGRYLYLFGQKVEVGELEPGEDLKIYKKKGLEYLNEKVPYYSSLMGVNPPYKIRMRNTKRTYGSNSRRTHTLSFQLRLMAFAPSIIDSVIVHELAHHFHFDHSKNFYATVYAYCPDYAKLRKKLIHDEFEG